MMIGRFSRVLMLVAAALGFGSTANAATYYLNYANEFNTVQTWATVEVVDLGSNVKFTVTLAPFLVAANQAIDEFAFNVTGSPTPPLSLNIVNPSATNWALAGSSTSQTQTEDGFGKYNYSYGTSSAADREPSPLTFEVAATGDDAANYYALADGGACGTTGCSFALHIVNQAGYDPYGGKTFYVAGGSPGDEFRPPVPLPATAWLLGSALLGVLGIGRRRRAA